ncbi:uncharacterized protein LOC124458113 isoform X1 [Xenia sp. Carnegie-2017]|uniref:uncharacterized protein LOC124458113 isoform X1 n=1 Tax=Xenia sp. Carnegie-2017 TaxID=2897299 RepID=UPI001F04ADC1|nr:uncharacterized protein LOC124458113 isoform X1 [Xenia sp. Carnegie-2017]
MTLQTKVRDCGPIYIKINSSQRMAVFSYAIGDSPDEFFVGVERNCLVVIMQSQHNLKLNLSAINDGIWHHLSIIIGRTRKKIFLNGSTIYSEPMVNHSLPLLRGGGVVAIGQKLEYFSSCKEAMKYGSSKDGVYLIKTNTSLGYSNVFCMKNISGCSGESWTLVMKIDGEKKTFDFDSSLWKNKNSYKIENGKTGLDNLETKLPTYWSTKINKICVGMKFKDETNFMSFKFQAKSLYDVIADGKYHQTNVSQNEWMSLIKDSVLQQNCNKEGFNAKAELETFARIRIGIVGNNENDCRTSDSFIGFGGLYNSIYCGGKFQINSCGNSAYCTGKPLIELRSMGYIFVS